MDEKTIQVKRPDVCCHEVLGWIFGFFKRMQPIVIVKNGFKPTFVDSPDKKDVIKGLKDAYKECDDCIIMTDGDNEGSAIGFHICEVLGIDPKKVKRAIALEITKTAVKKQLQIQVN